MKKSDLKGITLTELKVDDSGYGYLWMERWERKRRKERMDKIISRMN